MDINACRFILLLFIFGLTGCEPSSEKGGDGKIQWPEFPPIPVVADTESPDPYDGETSDQYDARMAWWRYARFGMFIHWGVYAVPAGMHEGEKIPGYGEWIMRKGRIPIKEYRKYAELFNPVGYDPQAWAELARKAGMRYMIITAKHHDGFGLFPSEVTDWDVVDATPYGKDLIGPLARAAREEGLKFGLYYSQAQDWVHPGGSTGRGADSKPWDETHAGDMDDYIDEIAVPQIREILTRYQPDVLWWDTPAQMNRERANKLIPLLRLRPGIIHNNRLGGGYQGDTETPEQTIPDEGYEDRDWEVCMTMNDTWGYQSFDHNWKSTDDLIRKLCDIVSKGGNFLLNVGPTSEGFIPEPSVERLLEIGAWMDVNGESIYGTTTGPLTDLGWGVSTRKSQAEGDLVYLQVFDWPENGTLRVKGLANLPSSAQLLATDEIVNVSAYSEDTENGLSMHVPVKAPDKYVSVIKLNFPSGLKLVDGEN